VKQILSLKIKPTVSVLQGLNMLFCVTINLGAISNTLLEEVKIGWKRQSSSEKKKKNWSVERKGMGNTVIPRLTSDPR